MNCLGRKRSQTQAYKTIMSKPGAVSILAPRNDAMRNATGRARRASVNPRFSGDIRASRKHLISVSLIMIRFNAPVQLLIIVYAHSPNYLCTFVLLRCFGSVIFIQSTSPLRCLNDTVLDGVSPSAAAGNPGVAASAMFSQRPA